MTDNAAKIKAQELIEKMHKKCSLTLAGAHSIFETMAKGLALIVVDQILSLDVWDWPHNAQQGRLFWESVREELNTM